MESIIICFHWTQKKSYISADGLDIGEKYTWLLKLWLEATVYKDCCLLKKAKYNTVSGMFDNHEKEIEEIKRNLTGR